MRQEQILVCTQFNEANNSAAGTLKDCLNPVAIVICPLIGYSEPACQFMQGPNNALRGNIRRDCKHFFAVGDRHDPATHNRC
jgi:hypothetical protein